MARCPEVMVHPIEHADAISGLLERADVVVAGPGMGRQAWGRSLLGKVLQSDRPRVFDADALNEIAATTTSARSSRPEIASACSIGWTITSGHRAKSAERCSLRVATLTRPAPLRSAVCAAKMIAPPIP